MSGLLKKVFCGFPKLSVLNENKKNKFPNIFQTFVCAFSRNLLQHKMFTMQKKLGKFNQDQRKTEVRMLFKFVLYTVCPRSGDQFYIVIYYMEWVTTAWTDRMI